MTTEKKWFDDEDLEARLGKMTLGLYLRSLREADSISQADFAKKLGISRANLCDLEKSRKVPTPERAAKIAKKLGIPENVLIQLSIQDSLRDAKLKYVVELKRVA